MRRPAVAAALAAVLAACGGGGGGGGGPAAGSLDWLCPWFLDDPEDGAFATLHNLGVEPVDVTVSIYGPTGALLFGTVETVDGTDHLTFGLEGFPFGSWLHANSASPEIEVGVTVVDGVDESYRAWPMGDLAAPPPYTRASVPIHALTRWVRLVNPTPAPISVWATGWESPLSPGGEAVEVPLAPFLLDPFASTTFEPDDVLPDGFRGMVLFGSVAPFAAGVRETADVAFDGRGRVEERDRTLAATLRFGLDDADPFPSYTDFGLVLRNESDEPRTVTLREVRLFDGFPLLAAPRAIHLVPREAAFLSTLDEPFDDLFGDALLASGLVEAAIELSVPADVRATWRQLDPVGLGHLATVEPQPPGHVVDAVQVVPSPVLPDAIRTWTDVYNPNGVAIDVSVSCLVPQPPGFDGHALPLATLTVPARGFATFSPDGLVKVDRDGEEVDVVGLRFASPGSFHVTGRRETRAPDGFLLRLAPTVVRSFDDAD